MVSPPSNHVPDRVDVVIVGGGLVGASMACALADSGLSIAIVEATPPDASDQPSYDERTVALTWSSRCVFQGIGIWDDIAAREATPITSIHVHDRGHFGMARLDASDAGTDALGYVVPHRVLGDVFYQRLNAATDISLICPATVEGINPAPDRIEITTSAGTVEARLAVLADGGRSGLTETLGMRARQRNYPEVALVGTVTPARDPAGLAYERFTSDGPMALLPASEGRYVFAWTLPPDTADTLINCTETEFLTALQKGFGNRAGQFVKAGPRSSYPLSFSILDRPVAQRVVAVGNAAHTVHPVAGQGFNLGLRDVADLAELVFDAAASNTDIGSSQLLHRYAGLRRRDTRSVGWLTDGLIRVFANDSIPLAVARNAGLSAVNVLPPVRRALLRQTMGLNAARSRLTRGLALRKRSG